MNLKSKSVLWIAAGLLAQNAGAVMMSCGQRSGAPSKDSLANVYQNPIEVPTDGREIADPSVYKFKDQYYLISTQEYPNNGKGFRVWVSTDLVGWTFHRSVPIEGELNPMMAPDLVYHEGAYYLYWSVDDPSHDPKGIHFAAKYVPKGADFDPFGPNAKYKIFTYNFLETKQHNIDGEIFFDGNDIYMFFCGHGGIRYKKLDSLEDSGNGVVRQLTSCVVDSIDIKSGEPGRNGWTEAPAIFFEDGYYYLTYSGVHFLRPDYQIHSARGRKIGSLKPYTSNPLIIHTEGEVNGMGNNNWITGPDLKTRYTTYHAKIGEGLFDPATQTGFMRKLMLDRYEVDPEDGIITAAPTLTDEPIPSPVEWSSTLAGWPSIIKLTPKGLEEATRFTDLPSNSDFVIEGYVKVKIDGKRKTGRAGITAANGKIKFAVESSGSTARLKYYFRDKGWVTTDIENVDGTVWHKLKIDKSGNKIKFYYDDRFIGEESTRLNESGQLGYFSEGTEAAFSWLGFSNH